MMKRFLIPAIFLLSVGLQGQTLDDALRYSLHDYFSTARFSGVSGAFSALGPDVSVASINPAGIAEFRKSEITFTINSINTRNESNLDGSIASESKRTTGLGNLSGVFHYDPPSFNVKTFNLAVGYNQLANYNETFVYGGRGPGTIVERFLEVAETNTPDELDAFEGGPAFDAGAIFNFDGGTTYESDFITLNEVVSRDEIVERSGSLSEVFIAVGSNINNKFSWGATVGFPFASFEETRSYSERDDANEIDFFDNIRFDQVLSTTGVGFNVKVGFIYKFTRQLRFGAAIHSKSYYFLTDEFNTSVTYSFTEDGSSQTLSADSPFSEFEYEFESPWRAIAGLGYIYSFGDVKGFFSGEVEYVNYKSGAFNLTANSNDPIDQFFEDDLNSEIDNFLSSALNIRLGTELAYKKGRLRVGAAIPRSPFDDETAWDLQPSYSAGIGYRGNRIYLDAAFTYRPSTTNYSPYRLLDDNRSPLVNLSTDRTVITFTFGSKL